MQYATIQIWNVFTPPGVRLKYTMHAINWDFLMTYIYIMKILSIIQYVCRKCSRYMGKQKHMLIKNKQFLSSKHHNVWNYSMCINLIIVLYDTATKNVYRANMSIKNYMKTAQLFQKKPSIPQFIHFCVASSDCLIGRRKKSPCFLILSSISLKSHEHKNI